MQSKQSYPQYPICSIDGKKYSEQMIQSENGMTKYTFTQINPGAEGMDYQISWNDSKIDMIFKKTHGDCTNSTKKLLVNFNEFDAETMNVKIPSNGMKIEKPEIFTAGYSAQNAKLFAMLNQGKEISLAEIIREIKPQIVIPMETVQRNVSYGLAS